MLELKLDNEKTGNEVIHILGYAGQRFGFELYNMDNTIALGRPFHEFEGKDLRFPETPYLIVGFGEIYPDKSYSKVEIETFLGDMNADPTNFEGEDAKYKPVYDMFIEKLENLL